MPLVVGGAATLGICNNRQLMLDADKVTQPCYGFTGISEIAELILSRLVDTFSSRVLYPMLPLSGNHSIAVVLSWEEDLH